MFACEAVKDPAERCWAGNGDANRNPEHEVGAFVYKHDGWICQVCKTGAQDKQDDRQAENSW